MTRAQAIRDFAEWRKAQGGLPEGCIFLCAEREGVENRGGALIKVRVYYFIVEKDRRLIEQWSAYDADTLEYNRVV